MAVTSLSPTKYRTIFHIGRLERGGLVWQTLSLAAGAAARTAPHAAFTVARSVGDMSSRWSASVIRSSPAGRPRSALRRDFIVEPPTSLYCVHFVDSLKFRS